MAYPHAYVAGIALFNAAKFWHAHEEWEQAWMATSDPEIKLFYKGIIQTAAALVHWQKGNSKGLHLNWAKARGKLVQLPPRCMGLAIDQLIIVMDRFEAADGVGLEPPHLVLAADNG